MKKTAILMVTILFLAHGAIGLERSIFANEIIATIGACALIVALIRNKLKANTHAALFLLILIYGAFSFLAGHYSNTEASLYQKARTLPIIYSTLCFFTGYYIVYTGITSNHHRKLVSALALPALLLGAIMGGKLSPPSTAAITINTTTNSRRKFYALTVSFILIIELIHQFILGSSDGSSTVATMLLFCIAMYKLKDTIFQIIQRVNIGFVFLSIISIAASLKIVAHAYSGFFIQGFSYFGDSFNANLMWRLMFWAKTINDMTFINWVFGIGLATPLFNELDPTAFFIIASEPNAIDRPYTLGLHNSILTYLVRLGAIGLLFLTYVTLKTMKSLTKHGDMRSEAFFVSFSLILIPAIFNVVLESPLYAGQFWVILGICARHSKNTSQAN